MNSFMLWGSDNPSPREPEELTTDWKYSEFYFKDGKLFILFTRYEKDDLLIKELTFYPDQINEEAETFEELDEQELYDFIDDVSQDLEGYEDYADDVYECYDFEYERG